MGGVLQENIAVTYYLTVLPFQAANVPDDDGNATTLNADSNDYVATRSGSIVGLSVRHNADLTGGVITWRPTINGTGSTGLTAVTDDDAQQDYATADANVIPFVAGDRLGVDWTKTGTVAPTTTDVAITLEVLYHDVQL
ncbi:MAG: hypothetical protein CL610_06085 [Anaerolineaceae bacterium]|nr:hypothetical protein [Anaerolineaceae bacterium]